MDTARLLSNNTQTHTATGDGNYRSAARTRGLGWPLVLVAPVDVCGMQLLQ